MLSKLGVCSSAVVLVVICAAGHAVASPSHADPHGCSGGCPNTVSFGTTGIQLSRAVMPHGEIVFHIHAGTARRKFVVLQSSLAASALPLAGATVDLGRAGRVLGTRAVAAGQVARLTLTLTAGTYVLLSNEPGDYSAGYHTVLRLT